MDANPNQKRSRRKLVLSVVVVALLAIAGFAIYLEYEQARCGLACGGAGYPVIQHAQTNTPQGEGGCQLLLTVAVCSVYVNGGNSGTVNLTVANHGNDGGGSRIEFTVYSSEPRYINFTAIPTCAYTSAPEYDAASCPVSGNSPQTFHFAFAVSQGYGTSSSRQFASVTIVMYQTCCFP